MSNSEEEIWKEVAGHEGYYVSNMGNVRKITEFGHFMDVHQTISQRDNKAVVTINMGQYRDYLHVHRLVADAFCEGDGRYVIHKDGNTRNNRWDNLEYVNKIDKSRNRRSLSKRNPVHVMKCDLAGYPITEYESITKACVGDPKRYNGIYSCCMGLQKTSMGYIWKFVESNKNK